MAVPKPGVPVRGSKSGRPIMALLDLLGRRWVLRILWELRGPALSFRELQEQCDAMSPTVLNQRLRELRDAGIVMLEQPGGYRLTPAGTQLLEAMLPLQRWAEQWQKRLAVDVAAAGETPAAKRRARATKE